MARIQYNISNLLIDIPDTLNGIGEDLTYTSIYDDIKNARFEEDATLSQGIWEHELQLPDWKLVEKLSVDATQNKSKDLQIIGWLIESSTILDKFAGISNGIVMLNEFIKKYWDTCYPLLEDKTSNNDQKLRILEWIYETIYRRSNLLPLFGYDSFSLYNYEYALELNATVLKNPSSKNQILESAQRNNIKLIEDINSIINNIDIKKIEKLNKNINNIKDNINELKNTLIEKTNSNRCFTKLINNIMNIEKLLSKRKINNSVVNNEETDSKMINDNNNRKKMNTMNRNDIKENITTNNNDITNNIEYTNISDDNIVDKINNNILETTSNSTIICNNKPVNRDEIYNMLNNLYLLLKEIDKHSPSSYLLNLILEWKDKTLLEIINDAKTGNTESHQLLRMLLS